MRKNGKYPQLIILDLRHFPWIWGKRKLQYLGPDGHAVLASDYLHEFIYVCKMFKNLKFFIFKGEKFAIFSGFAVIHCPCNAAFLKTKSHFVVINVDRKYPQTLDILKSRDQPVVRVL